MRRPTWSIVPSLRPRSRAVVLSNVGMLRQCLDEGQGALDVIVRQDIFELRHHDQRLVHPPQAFAYALQQFFVATLDEVGDRQIGDVLVLREEGVARPVAFAV